MSTLDYQRWQLAEKKKRWDELRKIVATPWNGDRNWDGRTIGLNLPNEIRNAAVQLQEKLQLRSMKEVLFKALIVGLKALDELPPVDGGKPEARPLRAVPPPPPPAALTRKGRPLDITEGILEETDMEDFSGDEPAEEPPSEPSPT